MGNNRKLDEARLSKWKNNNGKSLIECRAARLSLCKREEFSE